MAGVLQEAFVSGIHEALVVHEARVEPFVNGEEGSPSMDLSGRLRGLDWPDT